MYHPFALARLSFALQRHAMRFPQHGRWALPLIAVITALAAEPLRAQATGTGSITGTITDSVHSRPAAGAIVMLTRLSSEQGDFRSKFADDKGRFRFDSLPGGRYSVAFATSYLDSLSLTLAPRELLLADGQHQRVDFATPSGATLRAAACPGVTLGRGQGAVIGQVTDADTDRPLPGAQVAVSWNELTVDSALRPVRTEHGGAVATDSLGRYQLCGVPTDTYFIVQVQDSGRAGSPLTMSVDDEGGVLLRDLSFSTSSARSLASLDSAAQSADTTPPPPLSGTSTVTGVVRGPSGQPLAEAQVRVRDAAGVTRTDSLGRFTLSGQPAGTQLLETRRVGYRLSSVPVELRSGRTVEVTVTLARIVNLDSIRIVAQRSRYREFEQRRKNGFGRYLDQAAIEKQHPLETSDLFRMMPGFRVVGFGIDAHVVSTRGAVSFSGSCTPNIVIDGIQHQDINLISPDAIGAIEAYPGPAGAPMQYDSACGVVVIWTKR